MPMFHIQEPALLKLGFTKQTHYDKNSAKDTIKTLKFEEFKKNLTDEISIEVNYAYITVDEINYSLLESTVELVIEGSYGHIPVKSLDSLIALMLIIEGK